MQCSPAPCIARVLRRALRPPALRPPSSPLCAAVAFSNWTTPEEQAGVLQYGKDFLTALEALQRDEKNGAFITSCICHGCPWSDPTALSIDDKSVHQHYAAWMADETSGAASIHIDTRGPNGDGNITDPKCYRFPWLAGGLVEEAAM